MIITDEMILDLLDSISYSDEYLDSVRGEMEQKGYEVEKPKSKLELAREYYKNRLKLGVEYNPNYCIALYEDAIKEKQVDQDLIEWFTEWGRRFCYPNPLNPGNTDADNYKRLLKQIKE